MIRIITRTRLAALQQETEQARKRTREVQAAADVAYARHVRTAHDLSAEADAADLATATARAHAEDLVQALERLQAELVKTQGTVAVQAARIVELSAPAPAGASMVLLLHYGEPHSIHANKQAAYAYVVSLGAPPSKWVPVDEHRAAELRWMCVPFIYDSARDHFRSVTAPAVEPLGGAA